MTKSKPIIEKRKEDGDISNTIGGRISNVLLSKLAIFGDSAFALLLSFLILLIAVILSLRIDENASSSNSSSRRKVQDRVNNNHDFEERYRALGPKPQIDEARVYSIVEDSVESIHEAYKKDGVVAVRGLISAALLDRLDKESRDLIEREQQTNGRPRRNPNGPEGPKKATRKKMQFHTQKQGPLFFGPPTIDMNDTKSPVIANTTSFLEVAILSQVPTFGSQLMLPELNGDETVRMLQDIFLAKDEEEFICGWHVDDFGFWPATADSPGINAWIALDDMPIDGGGGFALAVGSHIASWKDEAHYVTGATTTFPPEGYKSAADLFENRTGSGTCNIETTAPHIYRRLEETMRVYGLRRGDVIFHQRWLFHRTVAFDRNYVAQRKHEELLYRRYSVRYAPGSAIVPPGWGTELSVLWNDENSGRSIDEVSAQDSPWYPKVWPNASIEELQNLKDLITHKIPMAEEKKLERRKEMQPYLKRAAKKQAKKNDGLRQDS